MQNQNGIQGAETPVCDESAIAANPDYAQWHHRLHIEGHKNEASCDVSTDFRSTHDLSPSVREALRLRRSPADTPGAISLSSSSHFALVPLSKLINPVALPPGRARLSTRPVATGSAAIGNTIGTVWVSRNNARMTSGATPSSMLNSRRFIRSPR